MSDWLDDAPSRPPRPASDADRPSRGQLLVNGLAMLTIMTVIIGGAVLLWTARPAPVTIIIQPPPPTGTPLPTVTPAPINVRVAGAVNLPDIALVLPPNSRVQDALDGAGGARPDANLSGIDLSRALLDGEMMYIPRIGETPPPQTNPAPTGSAIIHINRATAAELESLPGIGEALAARIITYREANGAFRGMADVDAVDGIGASVLAQLEGRIAFD
ncbi:MAG: ComEA family DNA-binding protein [Chloroflexota bacterium]|nr:ComEA family DNA-binding protein [Chloroflexota bacterium]